MFQAMENVENAKKKLKREKVIKRLEQAAQIADEKYNENASPANYGKMVQAFNDQENAKDIGNQKR
jgi:hypothetical protein